MTYRTYLTAELGWNEKLEAVIYFTTRIPSSRTKQVPPGLLDRDRYFRPSIEWPPPLTSLTKTKEYRDNPLIGRRGAPPCRAGRVLTAGEAGVVARTLRGPCQNRCRKRTARARAAATDAMETTSYRVVVSQFDSFDS